MSDPSTSAGIASRTASAQPSVKQANLNRLQVQVFGIRRSGNHAVIGWIMEHVSGTKLHLNNIGDHLSDPYRAFASAVVTGPPKGKVFRRRTLLRMLGIDGETLVEKKFYNSTPGVNRGYLKGMAKDLLLLSYEDLDLRSPCVQEFLAQPEKHVGGSDRTQTALILRDPFNQFASLMKKGFLNSATADFYVDRWKQYAREFVNESAALGRPLITINYNSWVRDGQYRQQLEGQFGFTGTVGSFQQVPSFGEGSSFQPGATSAQELDVFDRWRQFTGIHEYTQLFDGEVVDLATQIFDGALCDEAQRAIKLR
jgi:hypothetical protein